MPYEFKLPKHLKDQGWKVKISEKESREPPHVTIIRKTDRWQFGLREKKFLQRKPPASDVPEELVEQILKEENLKLLIEKWDAKYPENPVTSQTEKSKKGGKSAE
jgi:hypothetical protein